MNPRDEEILLTLDGLGVKAKREALERITAATRRAALQEAARLQCVYCPGPEPPVKGRHLDRDGGFLAWCESERIWEALSSSVGVGEKKDPTP